MPGALRLRDTAARAFERDPSGPRPGTVAAGVVAAVILTGAGAVALSGGGGPSAPPAVGPVRLATPAAGASATAVPVDPAPAAPAEEEPLLLAPVVHWQLFGGVALPFSPTAGPRQINGPLHSGYARSQTGALVAATQLATRYLLTPGQGWREVVERQVLPGVGREVFVRNRATVDEQAPPGTYGQPAGFRVVAFTPDVAAFQLVSRFPMTGVLQVVVVTVRWVGGDWRLQLQPDGGPSPTAQRVSELDGFVVWGP